MLDNPRNAATYAAPVSVVEYDAPAPTVEYAASVTTMTVPTTAVSQAVAHGSDYFSSSGTYDVWYAVGIQTAVVRYTFWPKTYYEWDAVWPDPVGIFAEHIEVSGHNETCVDLDQYPNANIAEYSLTSGTENSVEMSGYTWETGVHALHEWHQVSERCNHSEDHRSR